MAALATSVEVVLSIKRVIPCLVVEATLAAMVPVAVMELPPPTTFKPWPVIMFVTEPEPPPPRPPPPRLVITRVETTSLANVGVVNVKTLPAIV